MNHIAHCYYFHKLHPEVFAECQKYAHDITFWKDGRVVCSHKFFPTSLGNMTIPVSEETDLKLRDGSAYFDVTTHLLDIGHPTPDGSANFVPTLAVTGHYYERHPTSS